MLIQITYYLQVAAKNHLPLFFFKINTQKMLPPIYPSILLVLTQSVCENIY